MSSTDTSTLLQTAGTHLNPEPIRGRSPVPDPLSKAAQNLTLLQSQKFTGTVEIKLVLADGGVRTCNFSTDQQIYPERQNREEKNKK